MQVNSKEKRFVDPAIPSPVPILLFQYGFETHIEPEERISQIQAT